MSRYAKRKPSSGWKMRLTAGKIGFLLLTWSFVTRFGLPCNNPETSVLPNEDLVWRLLMSSDVKVIALRGQVDSGLQEFLKDAQGVSILEVDEPNISKGVYEFWPLQEDSYNGTILVLDGQCEDSTTIGSGVWYAYAILLILQLYVLNEFNLGDKMVIMALMAIVQAIVMIAVGANQVPDQTINLWVINN